MVHANLSREIHATKRSKLRGRSGGMLILVLIIMAVGVILITSAMNITIASRNRYYSDTVTGQARLTATAAAKTIVAAVKTQEIRDVELEALAENNVTLTMTGADGTTKNAGASISGNSVAPGIATAADSYTRATFSYYPSATKTYVLVDVETGLIADGATANVEHVKAFLKYNPPTAGTVDAFGAMVTAGGDGSSNVFRNVHVGQGAGAGASSNYVILHGDFLMGSGGVQVYGDCIYTGLVKASAGVVYSGDIVFYGDKAGITGMGGNGFVTNNGSVLFIGDDPSVASVFRDSSRNKRNNTEGLSGGLKGSNGTYLYNTSFISSQIEGFYPQSSNTWNVFVAGTSTFTDTVGYKHSGAYGSEVPNVTTDDKMINLGPSSTISYQSWAGTGTIGVDATQSAKFTGAIKAAAEKYQSADWAAAAERQVPTTAEAIAMTGYSGGQPAGALELSASDLTNGGTFTAPAYKVNASGGTKVKGELVFDLTNNDITIYVYNSGTLTFGINGDPGLFKFINGGAHWGRIIMAQGAKLYLTKTNFSAADNGIITTNHTAPKQQANSTFGKPHLYILGLGGNRIDVYQYSQLEGYVGMYGNSTVSPGDSNGAISFHNEAITYGRFEAVTLENPNDDGGGFANLYYCPSPTDPEGGTGKDPIKSNYTIEGYKYYSTVD